MRTDRGRLHRLARPMSLRSIQRTLCRSTLYTSTRTTTIRTMSGSGNDKYSQESKAEKPAAEKISLFRTFAEANRTVFLTTRDGSSGQLHARMMVPKVEADLTHLFLYDKESHKHQEVKDDEHVNVAYDGGNQGWASVAGTGRPSQEKELIKKVYNPSIKAWFADLGDGVRDGSENDPRIAILVVKPEEIRFYNQKKTLLGQAIDVAASAIGGDIATPGEILTITQQDIKSAA